MPLRCFRSPPAQNALVPLPVRITPRNPSRSTVSPSKSSIRSRPICVFIAFAASARFKVTIRIWLSRRPAIIVSKSFRICCFLGGGRLQDRVVLPKRRRRLARAGPLAVKRKRYADEFDVIVFRTSEHFKRARLWMRRDLIDAKKRSIGHAGLVEEPAERIGRIAPYGCLDLRNQPLPVHHSRRVRRESRIGYERIEAKRNTQFAEEIVVAGSNHLPAIGSLERLVGHDFGGPRAVGLADVSRGRIAGKRHSHPGETRLKKRGRNHPSLASVAARKERGE